MSELPSSNKDRQKQLIESQKYAEALPDLALQQQKLPETSPEERAAQNIVVLKTAEHDVHEAFEGKDLAEVLDTLDFSEDNYKFAIADTYHADAKTGSQNTRIEGRNSDIGDPQYRDDKPGACNQWGNPGNEAHVSGQPVEKVGIRESVSKVWGQTERSVPVPGWRGKIGFKRKQMATELKELKPSYTFDYEFAAPANSKDEAALNAGNRAGQNLKLSLEVTKQQAQELSKILEADPAAARSILDKFVGKTGDVGKWNADIFDQAGEFHDPGERYGTGEFVARDVRPNYDAVPNLQPKIIGLVSKSESGSRKLEGDGAQLQSGLQVLREDYDENPDYYTKRAAAQALNPAEIAAAQHSKDVRENEKRLGIGPKGY